MLTEDRVKEIQMRMKNNRSFRRRVEWYQLGQRRCHCCGVQMLWSSDGNVRNATVEHMVPASKGGTYERENIIITCRSCNEKRGNMDWIEFVTANKFPKSQWLLERYLKSVEFYKKKNRVIHMDVFKKAAAYKSKCTTDIKLAA